MQIECFHQKMLLNLFFEDVLRVYVFIFYSSEFHTSTPLFRENMFYIFCSFIPLVKFWWVSCATLMNLIDSIKTSDRFLRLLNSIVDTVHSACVLLSCSHAVGYGGGSDNENNWNSQYLSILYTLWIRLLLEVYLLYLITNSMSYN
jgi:hypothetical protein